eukprot:TRINITY_DN9566_c0_g1_i4.p1 TRINITY_DN9566_c0_g1~~TRINITY_DN9566_c0_g1_i4.p1  ORF type:complete len:638 (-),score=92.13 TRINITY_DN9566_c0_g1_i4:103-2016(-)
MCIRDRYQRRVHGTPFAISQLIKQYSLQDISFFLDLHGHSKKISSFIYACNSEEKAKNKYQSKIFPTIVSKISQIFALNECTFGINYYQEKTARALMWYNFSTSNVFTIETSAFGYLDKTHPQSVINFTPQNLARYGSEIVRSLYVNENQEDSDYNLDRNVLIQYIEKNSQYFNDAESNNISGSDSEPCVDEYSNKEKLSKFMSSQMAQQIGLQNSFSQKLYNNSESKAREQFIRKYKKKPDYPRPKDEIIQRPLSLNSQSQYDLSEQSKGKQRDGKLTSSPSKNSQTITKTYKSFVPNTNIQKRQTLKTSKNNLVIDPVDLFSYKKKHYNVLCSYQAKNLNLDDYLNYNQVADYYMLAQENKKTEANIQAMNNNNSSNPKNQEVAVPNVQSSSFQNLLSNQSQVQSEKKMLDANCNQQNPQENIMFLNTEESAVRKGSQMNLSQFRVTGNSFKLVHSQYNQRNNCRKIVNKIGKNQTQNSIRPSTSGKQSDYLKTEINTLYPTNYFDRGSQNPFLNQILPQENSLLTLEKFRPDKRNDKMNKTMLNIRSNFTNDTGNQKEVGTNINKNNLSLLSNINIGSANETNFISDNGFQQSYSKNVQLYQNFLRNKKNYYRQQQTKLNTCLLYTSPSPRDQA